MPREVRRLLAVDDDDRAVALLKPHAVILDLAMPAMSREFFDQRLDAQDAHLAGGA